MTSSDKLSVVMFTGGRGTQSISAALLKYPHVTLTLLVNTYDDGLSTGRLRQFVPGMLGPSDVRKNVSRLIPQTLRPLHDLIEYRLPAPLPEADAVQLLWAIVSTPAQVPSGPIREALMDLPLRYAATVAAWTQAFLTYWEAQKKNGVAFDFGDCSLGNIFFVGCYLQNGKAFNRATERFAEGCSALGRVLNITDGRNLVLTGLKENGSYLFDEAHIVSEQEEAPIENLYLLPDYLKTSEWQGIPKEALRHLLDSRHVTPALDAAADQALRAADIIIYGPGTQHSSLFPSYLTAGVAEAIAANSGAEKIFIGNIKKDHEIRHETAETLVQKVLYYLNRKKAITIAWKDLITQFFIQEAGADGMPGKDTVDFDPSRFSFPLNQVVVANWTVGAPSDKNGAHSGGRVLDEVIRVVNTKMQRKLKPFRHTVSIIVPGLDEARTVERVLRELTLLDLSLLEVGKEILYIDGGSRDSSVSLAQSVPDVQVHVLQGERGRGAAIRMGIRKASGDMIAFFPSDAEYEVRDLFSVVQEIVKNEFNVVYGSRLVKCVNMSERIREIYKGNWLLYMTSKCGGMLLSVLGLMRFNRFITDPLSGIKAFDAELLRSLDLKSKGFEIETEMLAKLGQKGQFVLEVPVDYHPRTRAEGKKTTVFDGLRAILKLL